MLAVEVTIAAAMPLIIAIVVVAVVVVVVVEAVMAVEVVVVVITMVVGEVIAFTVQSLVAIVESDDASQSNPVDVVMVVSGGITCRCSGGQRVATFLSTMKILMYKQIDDGAWKVKQNALHTS